MRKLFLNEDDAIVPAQQPMPVQQAPAAPVQQEAPVQEPAADVLSASNLINQMIKGEWDAIDLYNSVAVTLEQTQGNEAVINTIRDIVKEEYVHVGQLEAVLQQINGQAEKIKEGEQEGSQEAMPQEPEVAQPMEQPKEPVGMEVIIK